MTLVTTYRAAGSGVTGREPLTIAITRRAHAYVGEAKDIPSVSHRYDPVAVIANAEAMTETEFFLAVQDLVIEDMGKLHEGLLEAEVQRDDIYTVLYTVGIPDAAGEILDEASVSFYAGAPKDFLTPKRPLQAVIMNELYNGEVWNKMTPGLIPLLAPRLRQPDAHPGQKALNFEGN